MGLSSLPPCKTSHLLEAAWVADIGCKILKKHKALPVEIDALRIILTALFEQERWIGAGFTLALHEFLSYQRSTRQDPQRFIMQQGTFDHERTQLMANNAWDALITSVQRGLIYYQQRPAEEARVTQLRQQGAALALSKNQGAALVVARREE